MTSIESTDHVAGDLADDLAALEEAPRSKPGPACGAGKVIKRLAESDPAAAEAVQRLIDNDTVSGSLIALTLEKHRHRLSPNTVLRHRRRGRANGCRCER